MLHYYLRRIIIYESSRYDMTNKTEIYDHWPIKLKKTGFMTHRVWVMNNDVKYHSHMTSVIFDQKTKQINTRGGALERFKE